MPEGWWEEELDDEEEWLDEELALFDLLLEELFDFDEGRWKNQGCSGEGRRNFAEGVGTLRPPPER